MDTYYNYPSILTMGILGTYTLCIKYIHHKYPRILTMSIPDTLCVSCIHIISPYQISYMNNNEDS